MIKLHYAAFALVAATASVHADPPPSAKAKAEAKDHLQAGTKLYNVQDYAKAADEYQQAYLLDPKPEYLYALAQSQRLAGDCDKAVRSYQAFIRSKPKAEQAEKAQKNIERCQEDIQARAAGQAPPPPEDIPALPPAPPDLPDEKVIVVAPPPPPEKSYVVGHLLVGGGVAIGAASTLLFLHGRGTINDLNSSPDYDTFTARKSSIDSAKSQQTLGAVGMAAGVALIGGGIVYYALHSAATETLAVTPTAGGAAVTIGGKF
jgi:tetratricopeptide (TPR) repeat protein